MWYNTDSIMRSILFFVIFFPFTLIMGILSVLCTLISFNPAVGHFFAHTWSKTLIKLAGVKVQRNGIENIPESNQIIFIANHQSLFDIPLLYAFIPKRFCIMAKKSLFQIPVFGWHLYLTKNIPIDRSNPVKAARSFLSAARTIKQNISLLLFPEGTRSYKEKLLPFKKGAFVLVQKTNALLVPVVIEGTRAVLFKSSLSVKKAQVSISFFTPIDPNLIKNSTAEHLSSQVWELFDQHLTLKGSRL